MLLIISALVLTLVLSTALMVIASLISKKSHLDREKGSPFECGFEPNKSARLPFSLRFFLVAVIFLIFDVEITLILPTPMILSNCPPWSTLPVILAFILILLLGLYYEWLNGALEWTYQ